MPTYLNNNADDVVLNGAIIAAGKTYPTTTNAITLPTGVTKILDTPYFSPMIVSQIVAGSSGETSVSIPETFNGKPLNEFYLKLRCYGGSCTIKFNGANDGDFGTKLTLASGPNDSDVISWLCMSREIISVDITFLESGTKVKVDVSANKLS